MDEIVASASAGVTSGAMLARPSTLMCSVSPASLHSLEVGAGELAQAKFERMPLDRFFDLIAVDAELVADRGADEIAAVRVKAFLHEKIDMPEVDIAEIDRDFLALASSVAEPVYFSHHPFSICLDGIWMS